MMDFFEELIINKFNKGLAVGIITGVLLSKISCYFYDFTGDKTTNIEDNFEREKEFKSLNRMAAEEYKMALLVRHDLKMGKGKVAAQCSHAMVHCYEFGLKKNSVEIENWELNDRYVDIFKVVDEKMLIKYQTLAVEKGFNTFIVIDAGRTQVAPRSKTVMAIGPAKCSELNNITNDLELY